MRIVLDFEHTWLDPDFPAERRAVLRELAADHALVLFSNMAKPWIENDDEEPYRRPDHTVDGFEELPSVIRRL